MLQKAIAELYLVLFMIWFLDPTFAPRPRMRNFGRIDLKPPQVLGMYPGHHPKAYLKIDVPKILPTIPP